MKIHYLEIVSIDPQATCAAYEAALGVKFGPQDSGLGGARTAELGDGSLVGVRGQLAEAEDPIVRPYWLVTDIDAALKAATEGGAQVIHPPLEIPGKGKFAIYTLGQVQHGLWQL
jgi:predicted enzyme related to lactoylglutathione lyase